jgi:WD40 repeat protein
VVEPTAGSPSSEPFAVGRHCLSREDIDALEKALVEAFDRQGLEQLARYALGVELDTFVPATHDTRPEIAHALVKRARKDSRVGVQRLFDVACAENPNNPRLKSLQMQWAGAELVDSAPECPYPGMEPFKEKDAFKFYGRRAEINDALGQLTVYPFLSVIGPSGSGKSSLVFAGIVPALRSDARFGGARLRDFVVRPGARPLEQLAAVTACAGSTAEGIEAHIGALTKSSEVLLVVDQFEEVYVAEDLQQALRFQELLTKIAGLPCLYIILTARADFFDNIMNSPIWDEFRKNRLEIDTLRGDDLRDAIVEPAKSVGVTIDNDLVVKLLHDAADQPGALPFLQAALASIWGNAVDFHIPLDAYVQLSADDPERTGLQVAMEQRANVCYNSLTRQEQAVVEVIFLRLVQFGQGRADTRRQQLEQELCPSAELQPLFDSALTKLIEHRLLTTDSESGDTQRRIDIAHEALLTGWSTLETWIAKGRAAEKIRRRLAEKADDWQQLGGKKGGLLDELELLEAEKWMQGANAQGIKPDQKIVDLIAVSRREVRRQRRRERLLLAGSLVVSIVMFAALLLILNQQSQLQDRSRQLAAQLAQSRSRELAAVATNMLETGDTRQALLLSLVAMYGITKTSQAEEVLRVAVDAWRGVGTLKAHSQPVSYIYFSRDNRYLVTTGNDRTARVWLMPDQKLLGTFDGHEDMLLGAWISQDSKHVITASRDNGLVRIWRLADGQLERELRHEDKVRSIAMHPDGRWFAIRTGPHIELWDITTGAPVHHSPYSVPSGAQLRSLDWTVDGKQMLIGADDNRAHIIDIETGMHGDLALEDGSGHQLAVNSVQQSPDKRYIASMSGDLLVLWQWDEEAKKFNYIELPDSRNSDGFRSPVQFRSDSRYLAAGSANGKVRIWDTQNLATQPIQLSGHTQEITGLKFSDDGRTLASASRDGTVLLWNMVTQAPVEIVNTQQSNAFSLAFDRTGDILATADDFGGVNFWRVRLGGNIGSYYPVGVPVQALTSAGNTVYMAGEDGLLEEWDTASATAITMDLGGARLAAIADLGDGRIAVGDENGQIHVLGPAPSQRMSWEADSSSVLALISLPGGRLASIAGETAVKIWDAKTGALIEAYGGHTKSVRALARNGVSNTVWSAGADGVVLEQGPGITVTRVLTAGPPLLSLAVSAKGRYVAAGSSTSRVFIWDLASGALWVQRTTKPIRSMLFADNQLITGDETGQLQFWDPSARTVATLQGHPERRTIRSLALAAGGRLLGSIGDDGQLKLWPVSDRDLRLLACERAGPWLTDQEWQDLLSFPVDTDVCSELVTFDGDALPKLEQVTTTGGSKVSGLPLIYMFESISGTIVSAGEPVMLRWNTQNAPGGVYISINEGEPQAVGSPDQRTYSFAEDSHVKLIARNDMGEQTMDILVDVRESVPTE